MQSQPIPIIPKCKLNSMLGSYEKNPPSDITSIVNSSGIILNTYNITPSEINLQTRKASITHSAIQQNIMS